MPRHPSGALRALGRQLIRAGGLRVWALTGLSVANAVVQGVAVTLLIPLLAVAGVSATQGVPVAIDRAVSAAFLAIGVTPSLTAVLAAFILLAWAQAFLQQVELVSTARWEQAFIQDLRRRLYDALVSARWRFFTERRSTDLTHAVTRDSERAGAAAGYLLHAAAEAAGVVIYAVLAVAISPLATVVALGGALLLALLLRPTMREAQATGEELGDASADALAFVAEHLDAIKLVKSYGAEPRARETFSAVAGRSANSMIEATRTQARAFVATAAGSATLLGVVLWLAIQWLRLDAATILILLYVFWRLVPRLMDVLQSLRHATQEAPGFAVVQDVMAQAHAAREAPWDAAVTSSVGLASALTFDRVSFAYDTAPVLKECSFSVRAGQVVGITGPSGAGKTTLVDLVLGLLMPTAGAILVDARPLASEDLAAWRAAVGYVSQESFLFHNTIRANLAWAAPTASAADFWAALNAAGAGDFVRQLPEGLETVVGDRGVRMSGGERQRLALARALLRRPSLLVLDEPTSAVDAASEDHILRALAALKGSMTMIVVSHRAAPLALADQVFALSNGQLVPHASGVVYP